MKPVSSWGRLSHDLHHWVDWSSHEALAKTQGLGLAFGMGRSYGDVCLNAGGTLWGMSNLDKLIDFDAATGRLRCEAGVLLQTIQQLFIPRGWMLPVTPGTQRVTVGGAIANDVHGKNHHVVGTFGHHVLGLQLFRTDGALIECGPTLNPEWFSATLGGLGLTGVIVAVELQLRPVAGDCLEVESVVFNDLPAFFEWTDASLKSWEYSVAWLDCLSKNTRGLLKRANHVNEYANKKPVQREFNVRCTPPFSLVNQASLRVFNSLYFHWGVRGLGVHRVHYEPFFYPLDKIADWNRLYGSKGFYQYQCVLPGTEGLLGLNALLDEIKRHRAGSFLAVLKTFGAIASLGMLSFPKAGVSLALDLPNQGEKTKQLLARLDELVLNFSGRLYCAKNAQMNPELFRAGYPLLDEFLKYRDPGISSGLSRRLMGY